MTGSLPPSLFPQQHGKESGSEKRLSLAVARLNSIIARLNHLPHGAKHVIADSSREKDQPVPHHVLVTSVTTSEENLEN